MTSAKDVEDLFDLPERKRHSQEPDGTFKDKLEDIKDVIGEPSDVKSLKDVTHDMVEDNAPEGVIESLEQPEQESQPKQEDLKKPEQKHEEAIPSAKSGILKGHWVLDCNNSKFDRFYSQKRYWLENKLMVDGQIPFEKYRDELRNSSVDISLPIFDKDQIYEKMREVQMMKERVKQIQIHCNSQYFIWERNLQMFHGVLARVASEKPIIKNEGIIFEHMHDMENYFAEVKGLTKSADVVLKTLEGAHECLSRRITIAMPIKQPERYSSPEQPPEMSEYDGLSDKQEPTENISKKQKGSRFVGWEEVK